MRTRNKTPFPFGAQATSVRPPEPAVTLVVKATFRLRPGEPVLPLEGLGAQGWLSGDVFAASDDDRAGALVHASDFADLKLKADILVHARCHTPGREPMTECPVRVSVGAWSKALRVVGRRVWRDRVIGSAAPSDPVPFTEMPIDYTTAFGGPEFADNPVGKGAGTAELPNVEAPGDVLRDRKDRPAPASFMPISPFWPQRRAKVGKEYGKPYQEQRAPYFAEDFEWSYFNAAPADQQVDYLRGDEEISFLNLHPAAAMFSARLPGVRVRVFLRDDRGRMREVTMRIDTLTVDLEKETLALLWRGVDVVREDDLGDLAFALVAAEPYIGPPAPANRYFAELAEYAADPVGFHRRRRALFPRDEPAPQPQPRRDGGPDMAPPPPEDPVSAAVRDRLADMPHAERERVRLSLTRLSSMAVPGHDVKGKIAEALSSPPTSGPPPLALPRKPGALPYVPLGHHLRPLRESAARVRAQLAHNDVAPHLQGHRADTHTSALDDLAALENDPFVRQLDPYAFRAEGPGRDEPGPGADLSGRDLSRQDLSGKDLSGANLEGAMLQYANLKNANLRNARLKHAILYEADLSGADLSGADLTQINATGASARLAVLREARIDLSMFERADLSGADFTGTSGEYPVFSRANLTDAVLREAKLDHAFFDGAKLGRADASGATLTSCRLQNVEAEGAIFRGALLNRTAFLRAGLRAAVFAEARGDRVSFRAAVLEGADLRHAIFKDPFFDEANAHGARMHAASLRGARFYRASLAGADVSQADLLGADLRKADLTGASLAGASLFGAKLRLARREGADLTGANLKRTIDDGRSPPES